MPARQRAVVMLYFKTGSRFESPQQNGLSHFVEHMVFRGTRAHPSAHRLSTAFEELGGTLDASTAADHGTFGIDVPLESLSEVLPLMAEVFRAPLITDLEIERGIIREEVLEDFGDEGEMIDGPSLTRFLAFGAHGLGRPISGPLENVDAFTEAELRAHHGRTYISNDVILSVAGPGDVDKIQRELEENFSALQRGTSLVAEAPTTQSGARFLNVPHRGSSQTGISLSYRCPGYTSKREPAVEMLLRIIDDGMATRLYHRLCDSRGLCYSVGGSFEAYQDAGLVELEADAAHERAPLVLEQMLKLTRELQDELVSESEFARTQKRARWQHEAYLDEVGMTADFFAMAQLTGTALSPAERLEELLDVTREDLREAAQQIFSLEGRNVVCVGNTSRAKTSALRKLALEYF